MRAIWSNLLLLQAYGVEGDLWLNYPSWSVSAEFFAYIFVPVFIALVCKIPARWAGIVAILIFGIYAVLGDMLASTIVGEAGFAGERGGLFFLTFQFGIARIIPSFILGLGVARSVRNWQVKGPVVGALLIWASSLATLAVALVAPNGLIVLSFGIMLGVYYLVPQRVKIPKILTYLGTISYSIYMVHALVEIVGFKMVEILFDVGRGMVPLWSLPIFVVGAVIAAVFTYHFVEVPGRKMMLSFGARMRPVQNQPAE